MRFLCKLQAISIKHVGCTGILRIQFVCTIESLLCRSILAQLNENGAIERIELEYVRPAGQSGLKRRTSLGKLIHLVVSKCQIVLDLRRLRLQFCGAAKAF